MDKQELFDIMVAITVTAIAIILVICINDISAIKARHKAEDEKPTVTTAINAQEAKIAAYLRSVNGLYPELIAQVCMDTSLPEMCAAIAIVESNANPYAIGDAGDSRGAWQQQDKHWQRFAGKVSADPYLQAAQFDAVFSYMLETRSLPGAVSAWNGCGDGYVAKVWKHYLKLTAVKQ